MIPNESTYLLVNSSYKYDHVKINVSDPRLYKQRELTKEDLAYNTAHPLWIKIRLCLFWCFWAVFILVFVLFILMSTCLYPSVCRTN